MMAGEITWLLSDQVNLSNLCCVVTRMTSYVANHEKKNRIFAKRERELIHSIKHTFLRRNYC